MERSPYSARIARRRPLYYVDDMRLVRGLSATGEGRAGITHPAVIRGAVLGRAALVLGLFAALVGAGFATGIMAYEAIVNEVDYTTLSWAMIGPVWGLLGMLWALTRRWPLAAAVPMGWVAIFAGIYFSDVYGQYPAAALFVLATAVVFLPEARGGRTPREAILSPEDEAG